MRRFSYKPYIGIALLLFVVLTIPYPTAESSRSGVVAAVSPVWQWVGNVRALVVTPLAYMKLWVSKSPRKTIEELRSALEQEQVEVRLLRTQIQELQEAVLQAEIVSRWIDELHLWGEEHFMSQEAFASFLKDRQQLLLTSTLFVPARVIYRNPGSWGSSLWIDIGSSDNAALVQPIIQKNSPVVSGESLVGVIDYVGEHRSRVRLITDSGLSPSVRAVRLGEDGRLNYLAKGELRGRSDPLWRQGRQQLDGIGFNLDQSDNYGPAQDLRNDQPPIIQEGDLLLTTGMDGVFPPGLAVARVNHVDLLREGAYSYSLLAEPTVSNPSDLAVVFVLPSRGSPTPETYTLD